jgi:hypothetical protein
MWACFAEQTSPRTAKGLVFEAADNTADRPIAAVLAAAADLIKAR